MALAKAQRSVDGPAIAGKKAKELGALDPNLFTRKQAADYLGVGFSTIRWWHSLGRLVPALTRDGVHFYTREQLEQWQRGNPDAVASQAFKLFEQGETPIGVVIALHADPTAVEKLHEQYVRLSGAWVVAGPPGPRRAWERTYRLGQLTPQKLRTALELCANNEELRAKLLAVE
jgi:hypothetical protein